MTLPVDVGMCYEQERRATAPESADVMKRVLQLGTLVVPILMVHVLAMATPAGAVLPGESPADTYGVNGKVRSIVVVGDTVWIGGAFTAVTNGNSTSSIGVADGLVAFSRTTGKLATGVAVPRLTGSNIEVWKLATDGLRVWAAGKFSYNGTSKRNLISFSGLTGGNVTTYSGVPLSKSVAVGDKVYVGGTQVSAWPLGGGNKLSGFEPLTLKESIGGHESIAAMRDMMVDGSDVYGACQCSAVIQGGATTSVNSLIRFSAGDGALDKPFLTRVPGQVGEGSFGLGIAGDDSGVYLEQLVEDRLRREVQLRRDRALAYGHLGVSPGADTHHG